MNKFLANLLKIVLSLVVIAVIAVFALSFYFNPERVKPMVVSYMQDHYQRTISVGEVSWKLFPRLGISITDIVLGNAPGFGQGNFALLKSAIIFVEPLKLLHGKVHVSTLELKSPSADLKTNNQGESNWADLIAAKKPTSGASTANNTERGISNIEFNIESIEIVDGTFTYQDQKTGEIYNIQNLNVSSQNVALGQDFPIDVKLKIASNAPALNADIMAKGMLKVAANAKSYDLNAITLNGDLSIATLQANGLKVSNLKTPLKLDKGILDLSALTANLYGGTVNGSVRVNAQSQPADVQINYDMKGTDIASFTKDLGQTQKFTGKLNMKGTARFKAYPDKNKLRSSMAGNADMNIQHGVLKGVDLGYFYAQGNSLMSSNNVGKVLGATSMEKGTNNGKTEFIATTAKFNISNNLISNKDLVLYNAKIYGTGAGTINLANNTVDYRFKIQGSQKNGDQYSPTGNEIPLTITGSLDNPKMTVDMRAVAGNAVKSAVQQNLQNKNGILRQILQ